MKVRPYYIKVGKVTEIKADNCSVKVSFLEHDNIVSHYLPVIQNFAGANAMYMMPNIDDDVVCIVDHFGIGFCLGAIYNNKHIPIVNKESKYNITFDDGSTLEYDRENSKLYVDIKGDSEILIDKTLSINIKEDSSISSKNITIQSEKEVSVICEELKIEADQDVIIKGNNLMIDGEDITINGTNIKLGDNASNNVVDKRIIDFINSHTHAVVNVGIPTSTPMIPIIADAVTSQSVKI